jgi:hypothetical protein
MRDQRVESGPALGGIKPRDRLGIACIGAQPVDRLGRECDEFPATQQPGRCGDAIGTGIDEARLLRNRYRAAEIAFLVGVTRD